MFRILLKICAAFLFCLAFVTVTLASTPEAPSTPGQQKKMTIEKQWGVKFESLRVSANGYLLDFRYRIIDPEKASYPQAHSRGSSDLQRHTHQSFCGNPEARKWLCTPMQKQTFVHYASNRVF